MKRTKYLILYTVALLPLFNSCSKKEFLSAKPSLSLVAPKTLDDYQAILDDLNNMNGSGNGIVPALGEVGADDYFLTGDNLFKTFLTNPFYFNVYTWNENIYIDNTYKPNDWGFAYRSIFSSNVVLDGLGSITTKPSEQNRVNNIKGQALFFRAHMFYHLLQVYANHYDKSNSKVDYGIPIKLKSDISEKSVRSSVQDCYDQIIKDLKIAAEILPETPLYISRPSKPAAFALLARIYLTIGEYEQSLFYANECLKIKNQLFDFNNITNPNSSYPLPSPKSNPEIIFYSVLMRVRMEFLDPVYSRVDSTIYQSYSPNDLRKTIFFKDAKAAYNRAGDKGYFFRGSYENNSGRLFAGLATDEVLLIRAECYARKGEINNALTDVNAILKKRWNKNSSFQDITAQNSQEALQIVLLERRKELLYRGLRWTDIRRLNKDGANIYIKRIALNNSYTLDPNSLKYTYLIPKDVIEFNPDMPQNAR